MNRNAGEHSFDQPIGNFKTRKMSKVIVPTIELPDESLKRITDVVTALEQQSMNKSLFTAFESHFREIHDLCKVMENTKHYDVHSTLLTSWASQLKFILRAMEHDAKEWVLPVTTGIDSPMSASEERSQNHHLHGNNNSHHHNHSLRRESTSHFRGVSRKSSILLPVAPTYSDPSVQQHQELISSALYFSLETVMMQVEAERAVVMLYSPKVDELRAVCIAGCGSRQTFRIASQGGIEGSVFQTSVAVNLVSVYGDSTFNGVVDHKTGFRTHNLMCFPIRHTDTRRPIGIVEVMNKRKGNMSFDANDEAFLSVHARHLAYLIQHYPVDFFGKMYDPAPVHQVFPLKVVANRPSLAPVESAIPKQLVYRSSVSGNVRKHKVISSNSENGKHIVSSPSTLMEVDDYINHIEESWRKAVLLNMEQDVETKATTHRLHVVHEESQQRRRQIEELQLKLEAVMMDNTVLRNEIAAVQRSSRGAQQEIVVNVPRPPGSKPFSRKHASQSPSQMSGVLPKI